MINTKKNSEPKIAFCITCMNRLSHIQETLERNIEDNNLPERVQFVLLDYNSTDGLEEWAKMLQNHIDTGILHYYRTDAPVHYHRSHSRNMAFRLANAEVICNLDADNYLGRGFAEYILNEYDKSVDKRIFITSSLNSRDAFGRVCLRTQDFYSVRGYNELLDGYGVEDLDLFDRLYQSGLQQETFSNKAFYRAIHHPFIERIVNEKRYLQFDSIYLAYETPYKVSFFILYTDGLYESGSLIDNKSCNFNHNKHFENIIELLFDNLYRIILGSPLSKEEWRLNKDDIINVNDLIYYKIKDEKVISEFIAYLSDAVNFEVVQQIKNEKETINTTGFGQGVVYKNFDYTTPVILD